MLTALPFMPFFLRAERSTGYNEDAHGSIHGLTASHDAIDIFASRDGIGRVSLCAEYFDQ
jgi:hypothetical protein